MNDDLQCYGYEYFPTEYNEKSFDARSREYVKFSVMTVLSYDNGKTSI